VLDRTGNTELLFTSQPQSRRRSPCRNKNDAAWGSFDRGVIAAKANSLALQWNSTTERSGFLGLPDIFSRLTLHFVSEGSSPREWAMMD